MAFKQAELLNQGLFFEARAPERSPVRGHSVGPRFAQGCPRCSLAALAQERSLRLEHRALSPCRVQRSPGSGEKIHLLGEEVEPDRQCVLN